MFQQNFMEKCMTLLNYIQNMKLLYDLPTNITVNYNNQEDIQNYYDYMLKLILEKYEV